MKFGLVIPTNRPESLLSFYEKWLAVGLPWDEVHIVFDGKNPGFDFPKTIIHDWTTIEETLGKDNWIISRKDGGIRSFGILQAYRSGCDVIHLLDDDCYPDGDILLHKRILTEGISRWVSPAPGIHLRGMPYKNLGQVTPVINLGLWSGVPDVDAVHQLILGEESIPHSGDTRLVPRGQYIPISGMNLAFRREAAVLLYQPVMGLNQPYRRFDDIWGGIVAKRLCDELGWSVGYGPPYIHHIRASNAFTNLVKEAPGIGANEHFWEAVQNFSLTARTAVSLVQEIGHCISHTKCPPSIDVDYWSRLGRAYSIWGGLFDEA